MFGVWCYFLPYSLINKYNIQYKCTNYCDQNINGIRVLSFSKHYFKYKKQIITENQTYKLSNFFVITSQIKFFKTALDIQIHIIQILHLLLFDIKYRYSLLSGKTNLSVSENRALTIRAFLRIKSPNEFSLPDKFRLI